MSKQIELPPDAPGLDRATRERRQALAELQKMPAKEIFQLAVEAGIYAPDGKLTKDYKR